MSLFFFLFFLGRVAGLITPPPGGKKDFAANLLKGGHVDSGKEKKKSTNLA